MATTVFQVSGMSCGSCASSVSAAVGQVAGVTEVRVDLVSGAVGVVSDGPVDEASVRSAVEFAGYAVDPA